MTLEFNPDGTIKMPKAGSKKFIVTENIAKKESVSVIKEGEDNIYPIVQIECTKCDSKKAYFWTTQTRSSDESETKFYKCVKCSHTWRVYR